MASMKILIRLWLVWFVFWLLMVTYGWQGPIGDAALKAVLFLVFGPLVLMVVLRWVIMGSLAKRSGAQEPE